MGWFDHWLEDSDEPMNSDNPCDTCDFKRFIR